MNYSTRCTWCISLVKNIKSLKGCAIFKAGEEMYIDVADKNISKMIRKMDYHMKAAYKIYHNLLNEE